MPSHHGDSSAPVELTAEQAAAAARIASGYAAAAPQGWLRIVSRTEAATSNESAGHVRVQVVVVETADGLVQEYYSAPRELFFVVVDLLDELAAASPTQMITFVLVIDRDGYSVSVTSNEVRVLDGMRDEATWKPIHQYLERNREELERLAG
ncbi:hypothetical protein [Cellulomonas sp. URHE0023]|uniref:hypothetical protein n=1 Tax=Cellulomonas sp. URHE0023 TaxID=1380354 RepID=UPI0004889344|nr:hypothetical protein [Cellulomonas sp. URHE0023]